MIWAFPSISLVARPSARTVCEGLAVVWAENGHHRPLSVLVIDNHADAADSLAMLLKCLGHRAIVERSGVTALDAVRRDRPDVVVMELRLQGLDGWEVARRIWTIGSRARLIAVTTCGLSEDRAR